GHGVDVAGETQLRELVQEGPRKVGRTFQRSDLLFRKSQPFEERQRLLEAGGYHEVPTGRQLPNEQLEGRRLPQAAGEVTVEHRELVEIRKKSFRIGLHGRAPASSSSPSSWIRAPRWIISASARAPSPGCTSTARMASVRTVTR